MPVLDVRPGLSVAYRRLGAGPVLVCVPGGPGRASSYLDDLGGLTATRTLVLVDLPGTGDAPAPAEPEGYQVPDLAAAVQAVVDDLDQESVDVLGHSAGVVTATAWAAGHPDRLARLVLLSPGGRQLGLGYDDAVAVRASRAGETWYDDAIRTDDWTPFFYGRWDDRARAHAAREDDQRSEAATDSFGLGDLDPGPLRASLAALGAPALIVGGSLDPLGTAICRHWAELLPNAEVVTIPEVAHYPWVDDPQAVRETVERFLSRPTPTRARD